MTVILLTLAAVLLPVSLAVTMLDAGLRAGDRPHDASLTAVELDSESATVLATVHNPAPQPVIVGACLRRPGLRLRAESNSFMSAPRRTARAHLLAGRYPSLGVLAGHETATFTVPAGKDAGRRRRLVVAVGGTDRLRMLHRGVDLRSLTPSPGRAIHEYPQPDSNRRSPA